MIRFPSYRLRIGLGALLAFAALQASAQVIQEYEYQPDRIYPIRAGLGITTQIELSPNEQILDYSTGFSAGWDLTRRDNVFYLRPKNVDVDTNMMVRTAMHSYIFELKVVATDWRALEQAKSNGVQYKVRFTYPSGTEFADTQAEVEEAVPEASAELQPGRAYNFDYEFSACRMCRKRAQWLIPTTVYDDGRFTYIRMSDMTRYPTGNFPVVYGREQEGSEDMVVNTTVDGNTIIVHGTYPYMVIRHGTNVVGLRRRVQQ